MLGFGAVQLAFDSDLVDLADLRVEALLSDDVDVVFGGDDLDRSALGYLHANCAHCHNQARPPPPPDARCFDPNTEFDLRMGTRVQSVDDAPLIRDFGDRPIGQGLFGGEPILVLQMRDNKMPPLASEAEDDDGGALVSRWLARF